MRYEAHIAVFLLFWEDIVRIHKTRTQVLELGLQEIEVFSVLIWSGLVWSQQSL